MASVSQAARRKRAPGKGHTRFLDRSDQTEETPEGILAPHHDGTLQRMRGEPVVLCLQDGTDLRFAPPPEYGWQEFVTPPTEQCVQLYSTLAVTPGGLPLGVVEARFDELPGPDEPRMPMTRKTERALEGYTRCAALGRELGPGRVVCVMDRQGDAFEIFRARQTEPDADLLVHARANRRVAAVYAAGSTGPVQLLPGVLQAAPVLGTITVAVDRLTARSRRDAPTATLVVRSQTVELAPPGGTHRGKPPIRLQAVMVEEEHTPEDATPLRWMLLTTLAADTLDACKTVVGYYARRWRCEDWQRILKSGCRHQAPEEYWEGELAQAAALNLVVAWRLLLMILYFRDQPKGRSDILFSDIEISDLRRYARSLRCPPPNNIAAAVLSMVRTARPALPAGESFPQIRDAWRGCVALDHRCTGYQFEERWMKWP